jgi:hypothetical protein
MLPGLLTPTHVLFLIIIVAITFGLHRITTPRTRRARPAPATREPRTAALRRLRLRKPTRREAHIGWLVICVVLAFVLTRAVAMPLFLLVFVAVWACGYGVLARLYR